MTKFYLRPIDLHTMFIVGFAFLIMCFDMILGYKYLLFISISTILIMIVNYLGDKKNDKA